MNKYMHMFLNFPEKIESELQFINTFRDKITNSKNETTTSASNDEWEKLLHTLQYRYALDVRGDIEEILSDYKLRKTNTNFLSLLFRIVLKVDEHLDFHPYALGTSSNSEDKDEWVMKELGELFEEHMEKSFRLFRGKEIEQSMTYTYSELLQIALSKLEYVIAHLWIIIENLLFCTEASQSSSEPSKPPLPSSYFPNIFKAQKEPLNSKHKKKNHCADTYFLTRLNQIAKDDFVILLTSPESTFQKYIDKWFKEDGKAHRIPLKWTGGTDEVRLSAVASGRSMYSKVYTDGSYTMAEYNTFLFRYRTYLSMALTVPKENTLKTPKQKYFSSKYRKANRLSAYYFSERLYGFDLVHHIAEYFPTAELEEEEQNAWMKLLAKLIRIPNVTLRALYAEKLLMDAENLKMNERELLFFAEKVVESVVTYETTVYYPILMIYALQCMEMLCERCKTQEIDPLLGIKNAANDLRFQTPLKWSNQQAKQLLIQDDFGIGAFYAEILKEMYSPKKFEAVFGTRCFNDHIEAREYFFKMYHNPCL